MSIRTTINSLVTMIIVLSILVGLCGVWLLAASPVSTRAEGYIGAVMLLAMIVILFLGHKLHFQGPWVAPLRIISIFLAIFLTARYLIWRVEFTIGGYGIVSLIVGLTLFAAEIYSAGFALFEPPRVSWRPFGLSAGR